jgi:NAD(P)-dependent dehydrogenase (short-subunit alcohol dehydrogenase family)
LAHAIASKSPSLLILTARSTTKAHAVAKKLEDDYPSVDVRVLQLDLSSQRSVRQAATELDNLTQTIDVLINNAGVMGLSERTLSQDGVEMQFATNYLGHFLFTNLLMGKMVASAAQRPAGQTRIVNITSAGHVLTPVRFSDYNYEGKAVPPEEQPDVVIAAKMGMPDLDPRSGYLPLFAYAQSNTANMLFTVQLADSLQEKGICSFSAAPGGMALPLYRILHSSKVDSAAE